MPVLSIMSDTVDTQKRFKVAVDVIQKLPKDGSYRPSYEVMLRFYSLYKQAVCGPCNISRPAFWDPVGRYKWDAWSRLGEMSCENAMAEYVEEMKKVAQEVIDTMPMNEKTASLFHHFEKLYVVIHDMPRPPASLLNLCEDIKDTPLPASLTEAEDVRGTEEEPRPQEPDLESHQTHQITSTTLIENAHYEGLILTSDSESEIFSDSVELLDDVKVKIPTSNENYSGHAYSEPFSVQAHHRKVASQATQVGAGHGGEGAENRKGPPTRRSQDAGREGMQHGWRERGVAPGSPKQAGRGGQGYGNGAGSGGEDGSEEGAERLQNMQLEEQIVLALGRLREDMRSVMDRLEVVERLAAVYVQNPDWKPCTQCAASNSESENEKWWPFDLSGRTMLLLLLWPFVAQGLVFFLRGGQRKNHIPI